MFSGVECLLLFCHEYWLGIEVLCIYSTFWLICTWFLHVYVFISMHAFAISPVCIESVVLLSFSVSLHLAVFIYWYFCSFSICQLFSLYSVSCYDLCLSDYINKVYTNMYAVYRFV